MAIKLEVEDYCSDCERFEANVTRNPLIVENRSDKQSGYRFDCIVYTKITCVHKTECMAMIDYLKSKIKKEG